MNCKRAGNVSNIIFLFVEVVLFSISQFSDTEYVDELHYTGIVLSFLFAIGFFLALQGKERKKGIVVLGMFFTCIADYFLILLNDYFVVGVLFFFLTQICYFLYLSRECSSRERTVLVIRRVAIVAAAGLLIMLGIRQFSGLVLAVSFYIITFAGNVVIGWKRYPKQLFSIGLVLFFCCDICVGLSNSGLAKVEGVVVPYASVFRWLIYLFYMPSQVCIALSIRRKNAC